MFSVTGSFEAVSIGSIAMGTFEEMKDPVEKRASVNVRKNEQELGKTT